MARNIAGNGSREAEIQHRLSKALLTASRLKFFWKKTNASLKWKLLIYNAIIIAQVTYGLDVMHITETILRKLNAFHFRGLRIILGIEHSYYSRVTNQEVLRKANIVLNGGQDLELTWEQFILLGNALRVVPVGDIILGRQQKILSHVMRADRADPMFEVSFTEDMFIKTLSSKRVGRPRQHFIQETMNRVYWNLYSREYDEEELYDRSTLLGDAFAYNF